ncbi:MAG TPA: PH domain-containing protein [Acidimicrobiales bacterium]|nr:PH domain-containing protein [Acidimicrobiales bacterium]
MHVWMVAQATTAVVGLALVGVGEAVLAGATEVELPWPPGLVTAVVAVVAVAVVWWFPRRAYERWTYELAAETLELRRGVVVARYTAIPYFRVQHIDVSRGPVERLLGLSELVVRTAAATTDARIPGVAAAEAEALRDVILDRTGRGDAV